MIFSHTFDGLSQQEIAVLDAYFDGYDYQSSDYTYLANYIWRNTHRLSWQIFGDYLCVACEGSVEEDGELDVAGAPMAAEYAASEAQAVRQAASSCGPAGRAGAEPETTQAVPASDAAGAAAGEAAGDGGDEEGFCYVAFPLTRTGSYDKESLRQTIDAVRAHFAAAGMAMGMGVPGKLVPFLRDIYGDQVEITHQRDDDDYVYLRAELVTLAGRKLHQKKNHLNYFLRNYPYTYEEITPETVPEVRAFLSAINDEKAEELPAEWRHILRLESQAIEELLPFVGTGRLLTGAIRISGHIQAVTIGEYARTGSHETVIVHIEKAANAYRGLYQAINNEFCRHLPEDVIYVNREEDMGMENLRQTKESYKPCYMAEKYSAVWK